MKLYDELSAIVDALHAAEVPFALCGGLAVAVHGYVRATKDIDLLVPADSVDRAKAAVKPLGFSLPSLPMTFSAGTPRARRVHRVNKIVGEDHLILDLLEISRDDDEVWTGRLVLEWEGKRLSVTTSEAKSEPVDMSPAGVARRLREVSEILELCLSLQKAKHLGTASDLERSSPPLAHRKAS